MQKKHHVGKEILAGAALAALVAGAAGAYFLYGAKDAAKNRKKVKAWSLKAKAEVLEKMEKLKDINEPIYHNIVEQVSNKYQALKHIDKKDVEAFAKELKSHWKSFAKEIKAFHAKKK